MRLPPGRFALLALLVCLPLAGTAEAEEACEPAEPRVPRGLNVRASLGPAVWVGDVAEFSQPGLGFTFGVAYEFFSWAALEASWSTGFHNTDQPRPPAPGSFGAVSDPRRSGAAVFCADSELGSHVHPRPAKILLERPVGRWGESTPAGQYHIGPSGGRRSSTTRASPRTPDHSPTRGRDPRPPSTRR